jgi:hypothetical protein
MSKLIHSEKASRKYIVPIKGDEEYIYFIWGSGLIKIGRTRQLWYRLSLLQANSPVLLALIGYIVTTNSVELESWLHLKNINWFSHGEWFYENDKLWEYIVENVELIGLKAFIRNNTIRRGQRIKKR